MSFAPFRPVYAFNVKSSEHYSGDPSWWLTEALAADTDAPLTPRLAGKMSVDVAIVRGGFTGLWTAALLKERAPDPTGELIEAAVCGAGASGKNGGKCHGYWASLAGISANLGPDAALQIAWAGTRAQDAIRKFATAPGRDVWWREAGNVKVATTRNQDAKLKTGVDAAVRLGEPDRARLLSPEEVAQYCTSPVFRAAVFYPEGATVQPVRLARALRRAALASGVRIFEQTRMTGLETGTPNHIVTPVGEIIAADVVLATNIELVKRKELNSHVTVFLSYSLMTEQTDDQLQNMRWTGEEGFADSRMFIHYFRKTVDGQVLMGSGSGPISQGGSTTYTGLRTDRASAARAERGLRRLLLGLANVGIAKSGAPGWTYHLTAFR